MKTIDIIKAVTILESGGVIAFPTETVYGLGADASQESAIRRIFRVKERPYDHPLIVHIANIDQLSDWARDIPPGAWQLAQTFWPGPLTLVLKKQPHVLDIVTGGQDTIGLRLPRHPVALALLQAFGGGVAAPSANKFTHLSPTTVSDVYEELGSQIDGILEGGECEVGLESTILDMSGETPKILRPGMITAEAIAKVLGQPIQCVQQGETKTRASGMHHLHYAPTTQTVLIESSQVEKALQQLTPLQLPAAMVMHSNIKIQVPSGVQVIHMPSDAEVYAHDLYHTLRLLDNQRLKCIMIETVPHRPEWEAIADRLMKASSR
jgi:L-threonylcarbamoyladenylate synthase